MHVCIHVYNFFVWKYFYMQTFKADGYAVFVCLFQCIWLRFSFNVWIWNILTGIWNDDVLILIIVGVNM